MGQLTSQQYEKMKQQLIVPLAVSDIISHELEVDTDMQYGMHMALSEVDPDSALLAIAMCAQDLARKTIHDLPIAMALETVAIEILADYGPRWVRNNINAPISSAHYEEILETVPEDLESLADLLNALQGDLDNDYSTISTLANLLAIQARAHMEIADFVLAEIAYEKQQSGQSQQASYFGAAETNIESETTSSSSEESFGGNNIIVFPGL